MIISHVLARGCFTSKNRYNEDIESVQTVRLIVAGQVKQKRAGCGGGTACTDAVAFKGRMGNSEMQMGPILIATVPLLETLFKSAKRKKQFMMFKFICPTYWRRVS